MQTVNCDVCGKEVDKYDAYSRDNKTMCHECAVEYDKKLIKKKCVICGKEANSDDYIKINNKSVCLNCAFNNGKAEYESFIKELEDANSQRALERKKENRKNIGIAFLVALGVSMLLGLITFMIYYSIGTSGIQVLSIPGFLIVFFLVKNHIKTKFPDYSIEEFYKLKYPDSNVIKKTQPPKAPVRSLKYLYHLLETDKSKLTAVDINLLVTNFTTRGKKVKLNPNATYTIEYAVNPEFGGFLMTNEKSHDIYYFFVSQNQGNRQTIKVVPNATVYILNCNYSLCSESKSNTTEKPVQAAPKHEDVHQETDTIDKLEQLERLEKLYSSGAISKDELERIKAEIIK